ncbi:MAG: amidohydrolase [Alphaproteobacteria bacterium]|nr:amidohydrolase [Alphaproteobacteria bacterium]
MAQAMPRQRPPAGTYVVEGGWILAYEGGSHRLLRDGSMLIEGDRIAEVRPGRFEGDLPRLSVPHHLVLPGFINGHTHVATGTPTRGIIEGGRGYGRPIEIVDQLSDDDLDDLTAFNLAEILKSGCTTQIEMSLSLRQAESYVRIASKWGCRGYPGGMIPSTLRLDAIWFRREDKALFESVPGTLAEVAANLEFARRYRNAENGRIRPMMSPHATDTHTEETMGAIVKAARELGTGIHIHLSQRATETAAVRRLWGGRSPAQWLEKLGAMDGPLFGAHMMALDWRTDPEILIRHGAVYAHCPSAGGAGGASQPYPEALGAGIPTTVAIDTHSNDFIENLKLAVIGGKARAKLIADRSPVPVKSPTIWTAVEGATLVAAKGLGRDDLGRLAAGAKADFSTVDVSGFLFGAGAAPPEPLNNLLYCNGTAVKNVATDGRFQVFDGRLTVADEAEVFARGAAVVTKVWTRLEAEKWFTPTPR